MGKASAQKLNVFAKPDVVLFVHIDILSAVVWRHFVISMQHSMLVIIHYLAAGKYVSENGRHSTLSPATITVNI